MKKTIIFLLVTIQFHKETLANNSCSTLQKKIQALNEILESEKLSKHTYEIAFCELMRFEAQLEECEQKEKNARLPKENAIIKKPIN